MIKASSPEIWAYLSSSDGNVNYESFVRTILSQ